jgi:hypothetical protein
VEDKDKIREDEKEDVEAHGKGKLKAQSADEPKAEGEEDDVELHGKGKLKA